MSAYKEQAIAQIRAQVADAKVNSAVSPGGVDSSRRGRPDPRGDRRPAHLRLRRHRPDSARARPQNVETLYHNHYHIPMVARRPENLFLNALDGVDEPRAKRKTIGRTFIEVFDVAARDRRRQIPRPGHALSGRDRKRPARRRPRRHHQDAPQCRRPARAMGFELIEPLRDLFKDEVRDLGRGARPPRELRLPSPLPRAPASPSAASGDHPRQARDPAQGRRDLSRPEPPHAGLYRRDSQAFAVLLPVQPSASWATAAPTKTSSPSAASPPTTA